MKLVCLDFETSGLDPRTSEIVEVALMTWDDGKRGQIVTERFMPVGNTAAPEFVSAAKINGYTIDGWGGKPRLSADFIKKIVEVIGAHDGCMLGSNPWFDFRFLETAAERFRVPMDRVRLIDTASLATPLKIAGKVPGLSLSDLASALLGKQRGNTHSASEDVQLTVEVFEAIVGRYYKALV
jgi:DNA polymerase III alpha subunit (gram-positive type)